jgi:glutaredoxin
MGELRFRLLPLVLLAAAACGDAGSDADASTSTAQAVPVVSDARKDLVLSWYGDGGPEVASSVAEVPEEARREVRVQDPSIPPEARDPGVVFVADLTSPKADGSYPVRAVKRADYEKRQSRLKPEPPPGVAAASPPGEASGGTPVVMYSTKHCPVCVTARRWLLDQGIPYVEKDLEEDQAAAAELAAKGRAQGVPTSGVPIFEVRGRLIPGFDQGAIRAALSGAPLAAPPAPGPSPAPPTPQRIPLQPMPQAPPGPPAGTQQAI